MLEDKKSQLRKWYKYICKRGLYEKSVRLKGEIAAWEWNECLSQRVVLELEEWKISRSETITCGPLTGYKMQRGITIDGYFRLRTDKDYYPRCGRAGIPHEQMSRAAKGFARELEIGFQKQREAKTKKQKREAPIIERIKLLSTSIDRIGLRLRKIKRARARSQKVKPTIKGPPKTISAGKKTIYFFQMQACAHAISKYVETQTK